jgi:formylglycine-generating enzyme required for sulfatase activity
MKTCCIPVRETAADRPAQTYSACAADVADPQSAVAGIPGGLGLLGTGAPHFPDDGEGPLRRKKLKPFRMDVTTVTNARFARFVADTGHRTDAERLGDTLVFQGLLPTGHPPTRAVAEAPWWRLVPGATWRMPTGPLGAAAEPDHPVVHVSWNDAQAFASWAGGRLPTEAEWEHAARGGLGDVPFPWGEAQPNDTDFHPCNIWQGSFPRQDLGLDGYRGTAPARSFAPNGFGLFNMVGNVWEMTGDPFKVRSLKKSVTVQHAGRKGFKLSKGGSFLCHRSYCYRYRIAARNSTSANSSTSHIGFRLAYDGAATD